MPHKTNGNISFWIKTKLLPLKHRTIDETKLYKGIGETKLMNKRLKKYWTIKRNWNNHKLIIKYIETIGETKQTQEQRKRQKYTIVIKTTYFIKTYVGLILKVMLWALIQMIPTMPSPRTPIPPDMTRIRRFGIYFSLRLFKKNGFAFHENTAAIIHRYFFHWVKAKEVITK